MKEGTCLRAKLFGEQVRGNTPGVWTLAVSFLDLFLIKLSLSAGLELPEGGCPCAGTQPCIPALSLGRLEWLTLWELCPSSRYSPRNFASSLARGA